MNERLFEENEEITLKKLEKIFVEEVKDDIKNKEEDIDPDKWNIFPVLYLERKEKIEKVFEFIRYVDELENTRSEKAALVLSCIYLLEKTNVDIMNMDFNDIYLLSYSFSKEDIEDISEKLDILNDSNLLYTIRTISLDLDVRKKALDFAVRNNKTSEDLITLVSEKRFYEVLQILE